MEISSNALRQRLEPQPEV